MKTGSKLATVRAWLDGRGKPYRETDGGLLIRLGMRELDIAVTDGGYTVNGKPYKSQREIINREIIPFYGNKYREV